MENNEQFVKEQLDKHLEGYGTLDEIIDNEVLKEILLDMDTERLEKFRTIFSQTITISIPDSEPKVLEGVLEACEELLPKHTTGARVAKTDINNAIKIHSLKSTEGVDELVKKMDEAFVEVSNSHKLTKKELYPTKREWFKNQLEELYKKKTIKELIEKKHHHDVNNHKMKENLINALT